MAYLCICLFRRFQRTASVDEQRSRNDKNIRIKKKTVLAYEYTLKVPFITLLLTKSINSLICNTFFWRHMNNTINTLIVIMFQRKEIVFLFSCYFFTVIILRVSGYQYYIWIYTNFCRGYKKQVQPIKSTSLSCLMCNRFFLRNIKFTVNLLIVMMFQRKEIVFFSSHFFYCYFETFRVSGYQYYIYDISLKN